MYISAKNLAQSRHISKAIILVLLIAIAIPIAALPTITAQTANPQKQTYAYIGAIPNPAGVGQEILLHVGITDASSWQHGPWTGLTVEVTKPDGSKETLGPITTDLTGGTGVVYIATTPGVYKFQTHCPQQEPLKATISGTGTAGTVLLASSSEVLSVVVNEEIAPLHPGFSLPTEYWTRPIDGQIREWSSIAGSWVAEPPNLYAPYNDGPESAHVLWTRPLEMGGLVGGDLDGHTMNMGDAYEGKFLNSVIINGILYYNQFNTQDRGVPIESQKVIAVDLHTGEELWSKSLKDPNGTTHSLAFGQTLYWDGFNGHGVFTYLWATSGSTWHAFDAFTGEWVYSMTDVPSGTNIYGSKGEICRYTVNLNAGWMTLWNSTRTVNPQDTNSSQDGSWGRYLDTAQYPRVFPASRGIQWNVTIPQGLTGSVVATHNGDKIVGAQINTTAVRMWALSLKPGQEGTLLFDKTWNAPADWAAGSQTVQWMTSSQEDNIGVLFSKETRQNYGFSLTTGDYLWGPTEPPQHYLDALDDTKAGARVIAYGKLYSASVGGIVYCYDIKTGELLWDYEANDTFTEILWANTWWLRPLFVTDGKLYVAHYEHSAIDPRPRGAPFICLDAETGEVIWKVDGMFRSTRWGGRAIIGDSIIATMDTYDQRIYAIGKGPTATTVEAPMTGVTIGDSLVLRGTVVDISPGTKEYALTARFPNGVPAVSDDDMSEWMLYVYKQFTKPTDVTGVPVHLTAVDSNGNEHDIGTAISDALGNFAISWKPPTTGLYTVKATFEGSKSYYGSQAGTSFVVSEASAAPTTSPTSPTTSPATSPTAPTTSPTAPAVTSPAPASPTPAPEPSSDSSLATYVAVAAAAIIAAVVVVALLLKKRTK